MPITVSAVKPSMKIKSRGASAPDCARAGRGCEMMADKAALLEWAGRRPATHRGAFLQIADQPPSFGRAGLPAGGTLRTVERSQDAVRHARCCRPQGRPVKHAGALLA